MKFDTYFWGVELINAHIAGLKLKGRISIFLSTFFFFGLIYINLKGASPERNEKFILSIRTRLFLRYVILILSFGNQKGVSRDLKSFLILKKI